LTTFQPISVNQNRLRVGQGKAAVWNGPEMTQTIVAAIVETMATRVDRPGKPDEFTMRETCLFLD
jgi:hypothetical protein